MEHQITGYNTFMDDYNKDYCFVNLEFHVKNNGKKRIETNKTIVKYLKKEKLNEQEQELINKILTNDFFQKKSNDEHCKICSNDFKFILLNNLNIKYENWNIGIPTQQYTPFGAMVYLKRCNVLKKENFYDLSKDEFYELIKMQKDIYTYLNMSDFDYNVVGINTMFNQITVSQKCIHGHFEFMIKDIHEKNLGVTLTEEIKKDPVNEMIDSNYEYGLKINVNEFSYDEIMALLKNYYKKLHDIISLYNKILNMYKVNENIVSKEDKKLIEIFSPIPVANIYLTYYNNKNEIIVTPQIFLKTMDIANVKTEEDIYNLKYNGNRINEKSILLFEKTPIMRPSIKLNNIDYDEEEYNRQQQKLIKILERR